MGTSRTRHARHNTTKSVSTAQHDKISQTRTQHAGEKFSLLRFYIVTKSSGRGRGFGRGGTPGCTVTDVVIDGARGFIC